MQTRARRMFATIFVPRFALQVVQRQEPELRGRCVALVNDALPPYVTTVSLEAEAYGVEQGMSSAQAQGRCPELIFRRVGDVLIEPARDCLLQCAGAFSPWIEETAEGVVTMEWRFVQGGVPKEELEQKLGMMVHWLERLGFSATAGAARNPDLAILAARCAQPVLVILEDAPRFLSPLPLEVLSEIDTDASEEERKEQVRKFQILHRWGIKTLGQLMTLPKAQLIERLGLDAGDLWDRAAGCSIRLLRLVRVPERFVEKHELEHGVETLEPLLFILRRFVEQLSWRLESVHRVVAALILELRFDRDASHQRELKIPSPTADVEVLFRSLSTHLENVRAKSPVIAVQLEARPAPAPRSQFDFFSSRLRDPNQFYETLARLIAMLGADRVGTPVLLDSFRVDAFQIETPRFDEVPEFSAAEASQKQGVPLRRFRPPVRAEVEVRGGYPVYVRSEPVSGMVEDARGPWVHSGEWWTAQPWDRLEWDVQLAHGMYRIVQQPDGWRVEGIYD